MGTPGGTPPYYRPEGFEPHHRARRLRWIVTVIAVVFVGLALLLLFVALYPASFGLSSSSGPRFGAYGGFFLFFFILIVAFFMIRVVFWSARAGRRGGGRGPGNGPNRPAMVARMRYARGEITREQYQQIMQDLGRGPRPP
jgi:uncharacterized membrane protein